MRAHLERIFRAGVAACLPERVLPGHLPDPPRGRTIMLAVGKAAAAMARVAEERWQGPLDGVAVVPHGVTANLSAVQLIHAGHPVPDEAGVRAAKRLLDLAEAAGPDDLVLVLLSGGASALACLPGKGLTLKAKRRLTGMLLRSGATIGQINCVRRHLSAINGGRLAAAAGPARIATLAISDVVGNAPEDIGSGPTVADPSTIEDARAILRHYGIGAQEAGWSETPKAVEGEFRIIASAQTALGAAAEEARRLGYRPVLLGQCEGEARELGRKHAAMALAADPGTALISGGELTVAVTGEGQGGRNQEYALAAAIGISRSADVHGLAADTDGVDGSSQAAGAFFSGSTLAGSEADADRGLAANDSGGLFQRLGDLLVTGPTGTNVNDLRIILKTRP